MMTEHIQENFQLPFVPVKVCMILAFSYKTWCFSFHVLLTMLEVWDSAALAVKGETALCVCAKKGLRERKERKKSVMSDG